LRRANPALSPLPSFAELPKGKSFIPVGKSSEGTGNEASYFVDKTSIQKKGNQLYYTEWGVWKYEQPDYSSYSGKKWQYTKSNYVADCQNWKVGRFNILTMDVNGELIDNSKYDFSLQNPQPDTIDFKSLELVCRNK